MARRQLISFALLLTFCFLLLPACGDDDPVAPPIAGQLPDLATATRASVHVRVMGVLVNRGDITLGWQDFGTAPTPGSCADSNQVFAGEEEIYATYTRDFNRVHLEFDSESGRITRLLSRKEHANPSYSTYQSAAAHDIPLPLLRGNRFHLGSRLASGGRTGVCGDRLGGLRSQPLRG